MDEEKRYGNYLLSFTIIASLTNAFSSHYQLTLPDSWLIELATSNIVVERNYCNKFLLIISVPCLLRLSTLSTDLK